MSFLDWLTSMLLLLGGLFVVTGGIGAIRLPDLFTRLHAAGLTDTLGSLLILAGLMLQSGLSLVTVKLLAIAVFLVFTSPVSAYALASAALNAGHNPLLGDDPSSPDERN